MARRLTTHFHVCYSVRGEKLSSARVNPLLQRFKGLLQNFRIERESFRIYVELVDDFIYQTIDTRWIKCSSHLRVEFIDERESLDLNVYAIDDHTSALFHRELEKLSLVDGTYSHKIVIKIEDTFCGSCPPMSHENSPWPAARF